ncbi:capsule polysaccharide transporter [Gemmatimonadetes bacterium T265]|nr:capsule polysaccharide transporter [Gemmatimonadetes bacterium T265]
MHDSAAPSVTGAADDSDARNARARWHPGRLASRYGFVLAAALVGARTAGAQGTPDVRSGSRPSTQEAETLLQTRPDMVATLQQKMQASGMTPEQIRERLKALGYPESLLDAYLPGGSSAAGGNTAAARGATPSATVLAAVAALGLSDPDDADSTASSVGTRRDRFRRASADSESGRPWRNANSTSAATDVLPVFGMSLFARGSTAFDPNMAGPVDAGYRLGPGDRIVVLLSGAVEQAYTLDVTREGFVVIPQVGQLPVANLTLGQFEDLLEQRLRRAFGAVARGTGPASPSVTRFTASVAKMRSNQIAVVGEVAAPGTYRISSAGTGLSALYAAGGPTAGGTMRHVLVRRGGVIVATLDLYRYLLTGDASNDVRLENGDVVFVPVVGPQVQVRGEVRRQAVYELQTGETLADIILMAGNFTAAAAHQRVQIERILPPAQRTGIGRERVLLDVSAAQLADGNVPALPLVGGDVVRVAPVTARVTSRVSVRGNVWAPGDRGIVPGMRLSEVLARAGLKSDTYLGDVLVSRLRGDSSRVQLHATLVDTTGAVRQDFAVADADEIQVFSTSEFRPARYVAITGAVRRPGRIPYREGMTLRDAALLAGGLTEGASVSHAEVAHAASDRASGAEARPERVPLDSSYVFCDTLGAGVRAARAGLPRQDYALRPYDNVLIFREPNFTLPRTVTVLGEVRAVGQYTLTRKDERLADVLARAGGLTPQAYARGATLRRVTDSLGYVSVDLPRVLRDPTYRDNVVLEDGDTVTVPHFQGVVVVKGAVYSPTTVAYVPGADADYYVRAAGGATRQADVRRVYVRQPNGMIESTHHRRLGGDAQPEPAAGAVVTVPVRDASDHHDIAPLLGALGSSLAAIVGLVAVAKR